ncbi:Putative MetA-pathway of phenol degradation [Marinobacter segnicrescens]|uniref:Putative MetA-pathway of phenol degradation n=1 Tax=Marinobacter segnicrescens TaxID=430453 RepID=A0A1I0FF06_9GAMM|nr:MULTISPECIES: transporter [Marinobacter]UZD65222.1 transporter [Marinobacter sp. AN1]SET56544.1 Putative MetA-pathway of phenol degradation [Marinobacter segnicrescens]
MRIARILLPLTTALGLLPVTALSQQPAPDTTVGSEAREAASNQATEVASITYDRGIVTSPGRITIEPSVSYAHSNSTVVAVEGYTVIPALLVGLINISEVQRDIFTGALAMKYGFSSRFEAGIRVPYLIINEDLREREVFQGTPLDTIRESSGDGLGDVEVSARYQINDGLDGWPYLIGSLRVKAPTGEGPYDVGQRIIYDSNNNPIGVELRERPTGSGFWSIEPGISFIYPTDPAVLFGNLSYVWTMEEDEGERNGGTIDPGDVIRFGFGMGFAFNERTSFSLGYDHSIIGETDYELDNSLFDTRFEQVHVGSLTFGLSQRLTRDTSLSMAVSVGVTDNAPNAEITLRLPINL